MSGTLQPEGSLQWTPPHAVSSASRSAVVVRSSGRDVCALIDGGDLSAGLAAAAACGSSLRSAVACREFSVRAAFTVDRAGFALRHLLRISADRAHDAAHDADDDCAAV